MDMKHVKGENRGHVVLYALSTCVWCRKTKHLLDKLGVEFYYIDVDLLKGKEKDEVMEKLKHHNPKCTFPTLVINDKNCLIGYAEKDIRRELKGEG